MGGPDSKACCLFETLFLEGFRALRRHADELVILLEMMQQRTHEVLRAVRAPRPH